MSDNEKELILQTFYEYLTETYEDLIKIYKKYCYLNHMTYDEDIMQETVVKVANIIKKKGLKKNKKSNIADYFFQAFKKNLYQKHLQDSKNKIDDNIDVFELNKINKEYDEEEIDYEKKVSLRCLNLIKENFDDIDYAIFRLKYFLEIDGKSLTFKEIKRLTGIPNTRQRLVQMHRFLREHQQEILKK